MKLNYTSIVNSNTDEYPYRPATVIHLAGSAIQCPYNKREPEEHGEITTEELLDAISKQIAEDKETSAVVFTGSEPLSQANALIDICTQLKQMGILTKVETTGAYAGGLKALLPFVNYVSLEYRTSDLDKYKELIGSTMPFDVFYSNLMQCLVFLEKADVYFELKTTVVQGLNDNEEVIENIAKAAPYADQHTLKQFVPEPPLVSPEYEAKQPVSRRRLLELAATAKKHIGRVVVKCHECEPLEIS